MADRPGVMLYFDICPILDTLTPTDMGLVLRAALEYAKHGTVPSFEGAAATAWAAIQSKVDKDGENYDEKIMQRKYAVYCRDIRKSGGPPVPFAEWKLSADNDRYQPITDDRSRYPTTTTSTTPTTTPTRK